MKEFLQLSDLELLALYDTKNDYVIKLENGDLIHTDDESLVEEYENNSSLVLVYWASDFEAAFSVRDELIRRGLIVNSMEK
ncbi:hypothetical protein [Aliarcobacter butzleri]|uniref:hypothetical protein n=1 Tax=Aliarcobacter butzleri TaxID=28197 RepID=UPI00126A519B|nr:hypothetical protein [Aliarcobacter butzleri]